MVLSGTSIQAQHGTIEGDGISELGHERGGMH
jgi:hypothetical protein